MTDSPHRLTFLNGPAIPLAAKYEGVLLFLRLCSLPFSGGGVNSRAISFYGFFSASLSDPLRLVRDAEFRVFGFLELGTPR